MQPKQKGMIIFVLIHFHNDLYDLKISSNLDVHNFDDSMGHILSGKTSKSRLLMQVKYS